MTRMTTVFARAIAALLVSSVATVQGAAQQSTNGRTSSSDPLNLGFERPGLITPDAPANWYAAGQGYNISLDSAAPQAGARSLRIRPVGAPPPNGFGVASVVIPGSAAAGKTVRLRGYIRSDGITHGYAGLLMRADGVGGKMFALDNMSSRGVTGTTAWAPYEMTMRIDTAATSVIVGALHPGDGTAWFDSFSVEIDGAPYGATATSWQASTDELNWVRQHAIPLTTADPRAPLDDLRPVGAIVGDARIVSLGEGTHGTSEFFQMKHRITKYLAMEKGFTVFAIEANMPEARRVNEYVLTGRGDPKAALSGLYFWTWDTQEVLDMIEWMRSYNASAKGRIEFWGFDLQTPTVAMDSVRAFVRRADVAYVASLDSAYGRIDAVVTERRAGTQSASAVMLWEAEAVRVFSHLQASRGDYVSAGRDTTEIAWAIQNARIVVQAAGSTRGALSRDSSMATNVQWIAAHQPTGTRMVLWAHNAHVNRLAGSMGGHLADRYGSAMRVIGFALGEGNYTAVGPRGLSTYPAASPLAGSIEDVFRTTGLPRFALDLRDVSRSPASAWLAAPHDFRSIGAMAVDTGFFPARVAVQYDALIYFDHTIASAGLRNQVRP